MISCYERFESLVYLLIDAHPHEDAISLCLGYRINSSLLLCSLIDSEYSRQHISSTFVLDP